VTPGEQLASANAWHGRFNHFGNIVGFTMGKFHTLRAGLQSGFLNLAHVPLIGMVGGGQFRK
jgi:solute carrier family 45 protein 1/2/4